MCLFLCDNNIEHSIFKRLAILYEKFEVLKVSKSWIGKNDINLKTYKGKFKFYLKVWKAIEAGCNKVLIVSTAFTKIYVVI